MAEGKFGPGRGFGEGLFADGGEGVRALVEEVVQALIGSEADEHFGAPWNAKGLPRPNGYRNGLKGRELRTRMGTLKLSLPQARNGSFFPSCLERWQTSEQALAANLGEMVIKGVSTRKVAQLAEEMLGVEVSASTVSNLVKAIEPKVNAFRERAEEEKALLEKHWGKKYPKLVTYLEEHFDAVLAVLNVPSGHRKRLRTTNTMSSA